MEKEIANLYFDAIWSEVAFNYIGIQREIRPEILNAISEYNPTNFDDHVYLILVGRLLQAGWHTPSDAKIAAINLGMRSIDEVKESVDAMLLPEKTKLPTIFSDFFYMGLVEYSFGSRTMLAETSLVCESFSERCDLVSLRNCLLLLFAQRSRLSVEEKSTRAKTLLATLNELEKEGNISVREKFVDLFMLGQVENEDSATLKSIKRKVKRTKELYPEEMKKILPPPKTRMTINIAKGRRRKQDQLR